MSIAGSIVKKLYHRSYTAYVYGRIRYQSIRAKRRIFLIGTPWYGNLGDQAITLGEEYSLRKTYPDRTIISIPTAIFYSKLAKAFGLGIKTDDVIFIQGGGNLGSLYLNEEQMHRDVIRKYAENQIIMMPVSIFFHNNDYGRKELEISKEIYNHARDLTIFTRDEESFKYAVANFSKVKSVLIPDIVTVLDSNLSFIDPVLDTSERKGVLFVLRADQEKILSNDTVNALKKYLSGKRVPFHVIDTNVSYPVYGHMRKKEVGKLLQNFLNTKLVITDRFHGLIFSVITHTPVIVFKSFDTKISSGVKWFQDLPWVHYVDTDDISKLKSVIERYSHMPHKIAQGTRCREIVLKRMDEINFPK